ncbi:MAG: hypothetical protein KAT46_06125, partial [Deltaproteobacteria bacterium]|nr:hypothetical protein [Deltaproteobacteria bacterium]
ILGIVTAMEGDIHLNECLIREDFCDREKKCSVHDMWGRAQAEFFKVLTSTNFAFLAKDAKRKVAKSKALITLDKQV